MCVIAKSPPSEWTAFARFPTWMWRNEETRASSIGCTRAMHRADMTARDRVLWTRSLQPLHFGPRVIEYLETVDPDLAAIARRALWLPLALGGRPGRLWSRGSARRVSANASRLWRTCSWSYCRSSNPMRCEMAIASSMLAECPARRQCGAVLSAHVLWLAGLLELAGHAYVRDADERARLHGPGSKAVVWAHNSHIGDASATEMGRRGEHNIGQLCRHAFRQGLLSDRLWHQRWNRRRSFGLGWRRCRSCVSRLRMRRATSGLFHLTNAPGLCSPWATPLRRASRQAPSSRAGARDRRDLSPRQRTRQPLLRGVLPKQFDEYIWIDRTSAVKPFDVAQLQACRTPIRSAFEPQSPERECLATTG